MSTQKLIAPPVLNFSQVQDEDLPVSGGSRDSSQEADLVIVPAQTALSRAAIRNTKETLRDHLIEQSNEHTRRQNRVESQTMPTGFVTRWAFSFMFYGGLRD